jgi:hypothetical protein
MILDALAVAALVALGVWVFSGLILRLAGLLAIVAGLGATALGGNGLHRSPLAAFLIGRTRRD